MPQVMIRRAVAADAAAIQALYRELVANPAVCVLPERIAEVAQSANAALFVAELDGAVAATAHVSLCLDVMFQNQPFAVVENIIVMPRCRGLGVGAALMREVEHYARSAQCSKIMLLSAAERSEAHRFFEKVGFLGSAKKGFVKYRSQFDEQEP
ncbi:GNAT family N-acetyltransferase [Paludibacterium purpuratum]|uniref:Ribosomal protein S18 acetylase RimI-like enzyme n=1 Tax=Paludibacterium purpuratum TaxID=1144873 RepID=A0A4R7B690_9NEIS|nr:GNAT family N-acetyltransferase [Paludibacterium purpuratum]TDR80194.1 ribosomal protein S18 acetylase RimI-like enzyme [Paludibacterium purpuratum]